MRGAVMTSNQELIAVLENAFTQMMKKPPLPGYIYYSKPMNPHIWVEQEKIDRLFSPQGLRDLFVGLK